MDSCLHSWLSSGWLPDSTEPHCLQVRILFTQCTEQCRVYYGSKEKKLKIQIKKIKGVERRLKRHF